MQFVRATIRNPVALLRLALDPRQRLCSRRQHFRMVLKDYRASGLGLADAIAAARSMCSMVEQQMEGYPVFVLLPAGARPGGGSRWRKWQGRVALLLAVAQNAEWIAGKIVELLRWLLAGGRRRLADLGEPRSAG